MFVFDNHTHAQKTIRVRDSKFGPALVVETSTHSGGYILGENEAMGKSEKATRWSKAKLAWKHPNMNDTQERYSCFCICDSHRP